MKGVCLVVIDGWGHDETSMRGNAVEESNCRWMRRLSLQYHSLLVFAHGAHVGLPDGLMGNSEVGHLTIGSGRVVEQDIVRIDRAAGDGELKRLLDKELGGHERIHVVGMVSDGGVHSHIRHLKAVLEALQGREQEVFIHCISDGRDTEPRVFLKHLKEVAGFCRETRVGRIASVAGRFYTMDRGGNDERTDLSFQMMVGGEEAAGGVEAQVLEMYEEGLGDETLRPFLVDGQGRVAPSDTILFFNFRADRMRQIASRFVANGNDVVTMTEYEEGLGARVLFRKAPVRNTLAEVLSAHGIKHAHVAEREKQAHVTYFFNGGQERPFCMQRTVIVPSPNVRGFDEAPSMASHEAALSAVREMEGGTPFVLVNLAPPDMVGHTGNLEATRAAVEAADKCVGMIYRSCQENGYGLVVTADHGNAERMVDAKGGPCKTHTTSKVPLIVCTEERRTSGPWGYVDSRHSLRDVAPTVLQIMGIPRPGEMTGRPVTGTGAGQMAPRHWGRASGADGSEEPV